MKIGVFDSGLGGLLVLSKIRELLPEYNYVFFGDEAYVPYGNKTKEELFSRAQKICKYLFEKENCQAVLIACNTISTNLYQDLKNWVEENFPNREVWGIAKPTAETLKNENNISFFGTHGTISSHFYKNEIKDSIEIEMPNLASMIESGEDTFEYIKSFKNFVPKNIDTGVLVCTHYPLTLAYFKQAYPQIKDWICQEDIIPKYIKNYLLKKEATLRQGLQVAEKGDLKIISSKQNPIFEKFSAKFFPNTKVIEAHI